MAYTVLLSPVTGLPAEWQYWRVPNAPFPSPGERLRRVRVLIAEVAHHRKALATGQWVPASYLQGLAEAAQDCLLDVGDKVQTDLAEIALLEFKVPDDLAKFKVIVDGVFSPPDDPEYRRVQAECDAKVAAEVERFERALCTAKDKILGVNPNAAPATESKKLPQESPAKGDTPRPLSSRDAALYGKIKEDLPRLTNAELVRRLWPTWRKENPSRTKDGLRNMLCRIRKYYDIPAPKP